MSTIELGHSGNAADSGTWHEDRYWQIAGLSTLHAAQGLVLSQFSADFTKMYYESQRAFGQERLLNDIYPDGWYSWSSAGSLNDVNASIRSAFASDAKITTLTKDTTVYRYYGENSQASGNWVTPYKYDNPVSELALPPENTAKYLNTIVLPAGTRVIEGTVAPNFTQPGGGYQYYVLP